MRTPFLDFITYLQTAYGIPPTVSVPVLFLLAIWTLTIKGFALWKAARNSHQTWFIVLLVVNTIGILELIYLLWFAKKSVVVPAAVSSAPEV